MLVQSYSWIAFIIPITTIFKIEKLKPKLFCAIADYTTWQEFNKSA
jgi:hypothetical protein